MNKADRTLTVLYAIFGSFSFICFFSYLIKLIFSPEGTLATASAITVCAVVALPFIFRKPLRKLTRKAYPALKCVLCAGFVFFTLTFCFMTVFLFASDKSAEPDSFTGDTVFLVFGSKVESDGAPSTVLADRLDRVAEAMKRTPGSVCIVSGGQGPTEPRAEADAMRDYLIGAGIEGDRIVTEDRSLNTVENIEFSIPLIEAAGKSDLVCVSTFTHTPRIAILAGRAGLAPRFLTSGVTDMRFLLPALVREYLSYVKMIVRI